MVPSYGTDEILETMDSLLQTNVTMGEKVGKFEKLFSEYIGVGNAIMVNSGSSANLVALSVLASKSLSEPIRPGDEIITPAVAWSTTIFPIYSVGAVPVFVDVDLTTFTVDVDAVKGAITDRTRAIIPVHLLGNPCDMKELSAVAETHDLFLVEDACEAHGAETNGKKVGAFGDLSTFSFFFSHHISTIEGGMVLTDDVQYADAARSLRAHGWIRERSDATQLAARYPLLDKRFLFVSQGYNLRPTEIQGAFGIHQIKKLEEFIRIRIQNADYWTKELDGFSNYLSLPRHEAGARHVYFGYPVTVRSDAPFTREQMTSFLESKGIETRPVMSGDMTQQPAMSDLPYRIAGSLNNSRTIHSRSFFWANHHGIGSPQREFIVSAVREFIREKVGKSK